MRLKSIEIGNFKCFQTKQKVNFSRLTVLTGANSSGKSSLIYSIIGSLQGGEFPLQFSTNGKYLNLGDFKEVSHSHKSDNIIDISFEFSNEKIKRIITSWRENPINNLPELSSLKVNSEYFELDLYQKDCKYFLNFNYIVEKDPSNKFKPETFKKFIDSVSMLIEESGKPKNQKKKDKDIDKFIEKFNSSQTIKDKEFNNFDELNKYLSDDDNLRINQVANQLLEVFKFFDKKVNFISSFRLNPDRTYLERSKGDFKIEKYGEGYLDQLINWETKKTSQYSQLVDIMRNLNLFDEIKAKRIDGGRYEILVKTNKASVYSSLSDVGFGISQFLPIIVADLQLSTDSTLFIAQPEIHLHPSVQSNFGDYLVNSINKTKKNYVVETHSEYLLNKLRLLLVKGELKSEDIFIYYLENNECDSIVHKIEFTKTGQILNAPKSFFDTYMIDVMEIALNSIE